MHVEVAREHIQLFPERALFWEREKALFIADLHWGKAATFRARRMAIPDSGGDDLARLERVIAMTQPTTLYVLGDLLHAEAGRTSSVLNVFAAWRATHAQLEIVLVRGNHDKHAGDPPEEWHIQCENAPFNLSPFVLVHMPSVDPMDGYALAGHVHPGVVISGAGRQSLKIPCFWFGQYGAVLPAFGSFTGTAAIQPSEGDRVLAVTDTAVIEVRVG
jgi:DNA ligase-associated metallophosphoesterase